jgi:hypothetical protein
MKPTLTLPIETATAGVALCACGSARRALGEVTGDRESEHEGYLLEQGGRQLLREAGVGALKLSQPDVADAIRDGLRAALENHHHQQKGNRP